MLSFAEDDFLVERWENYTRWVVKLSNKQCVFQDDGRPGVYPESAWLRLKDYCSENDLWIVSMFLQFRSHVEHLPNNAAGYFFKKGVRGGGFDTKELFLTGIQYGSEVEITKWYVPELLVSSKEIRLAHECEKYLIKSYGEQKNISVTIH